MNKEQIMDYLYGELDHAVREKYDQEIQNDPVLRQEITDLHQVRQFLQKSEDVDPNQGIPSFQKRKTLFLNGWWSVAAALLLLLIAGRLMGMQISLDDRQLVISYGAPKAAKDAIAPETIDYLVSGMEALQHKIDQKPDLAAVQTILSAESGLSDEDKAALVAASSRSFQRQHDQFTLQLSEQLELRQQAYMQNVVSDLIQYWDTQRAEDIQLINASLDNLAQTIQLSGTELASFQSHENL